MISSQHFQPKQSFLIVSKPTTTEAVCPLLTFLKRGISTARAGGRQRVCEKENRISERELRKHALHVNGDEINACADFELHQLI